jgi:hypothetical protein
LGLSIVASWIELAMTKDEAKEAGLIGVEIATDNEDGKIFVVVGSKTSLN